MITSFRSNDSKVYSVEEKSLKNFSHVNRNVNCKRFIFNEKTISKISNLGFVFSWSASNSTAFLKYKKFAF